MNLPTEQDCLYLYQTYHTPQNVIDHMNVVTAISVKLGTLLKETGVSINLEALEAAGKLHDLVRLKEQKQYLPNNIDKSLSHAEINYQILKDKYPELALIIKTHGLMRILQDQPWNNIEQQVLFYADKRVNNDTLVDIEDRLKLGQQRWLVDTSNDKSQELLPALKSLENKLFSKLSITPSEL